MPIDMHAPGPYHTRREQAIHNMNHMKTNSKPPARERVRLQDKANSPGVPPNSCPYIDLVITMTQDLQESYDKYRETGHHNPMVDDIAEEAKNLLEYIRRANETLRDNSAYWYERYKEQLKKSNKRK